jgi:tRNA threonylcarbamoyladenosine biosynthesis protein TsaE
MLSVRSASLAQTHAIAAAIASVARSGDLIVLAGEMGVGKTAFAQGFGQALGVTQPITSPTYTLVHSYSAGRLTLHHADIYRLNSLHEISDLALPELAEANGVVLVEWGDVVESSWGDHLLITLSVLDEEDDAEGEADDFAAPEGRGIAIVPSGRAWATRWAELQQRVVAAC